MLKKLSKFLPVMFAIVICMSVMVWADDTPAGSGTIEDPYQIGTLDELYWFVDLVNNSTLSADEKLNAHNAKLTADIVVNSGTMDTSTNANSVTKWNGISNFNAVFDGNGHTISGLYVNTSSSDTTRTVAGFINSTSTSSAVIKNLGIINSFFGSTLDQEGCVCGWNKGTIENCYSNSIIKKESGNGGGIVGRNGGTITNCYYEGTIYAPNVIDKKQRNIYYQKYGMGGISGTTSSTSNIVGCYNLGTINNKYVSGGIVGIFNGGNVSKCYNKGNINTRVDDKVGCISNNYLNSSEHGLYPDSSIYDNAIISGGIAGYSTSNAKGKVENCYNIGTVSADNYFQPTYKTLLSGTNSELEKANYSKYTWNYAITGGIIGYNKDTTVSNCFSNDNYHAHAEAIKGHDRSGKDKTYSGTAKAGIIYCEDYPSYAKGTVTNCYSWTTTSTSYAKNGTRLDRSDFSSGKVAYLLNNSTDGGTVWYQNIDMGAADSLPILDETHYRVYNTADSTYSNAPTEAITGLCGSGRNKANQTYTIDLANKAVTVLGTGNMINYSADSPSPWAEYAPYIEYVDIAPSAQIDAEAFDGCDKIKVLYCYEGSPAETFFADNSSVTKKYVLDDTAVQLSGFDTTTQAFTISVNTNEFGSTGAKYLEGVKVIVNNGESSEYVTNYQEDTNNNSYANFAVQLDGTLNSYTDIRAEVLAKDSAADDSITYYVSEPYSNLSTEV